MHVYVIFVLFSIGKLYLLNNLAHILVNNKKSTHTHILSAVLNAH